VSSPQTPATDPRWPDLRRLARGAAVAASTAAAGTSALDTRITAAEGNITALEARVTTAETDITHRAITPAGGAALDIDNGTLCWNIDADPIEQMVGLI